MKDTKKGKRLKRGIQDWWTTLALYEAAKRYRQRNGLPAGSKVVIGLDEVNAIIEKWNRNPLRRLWMLITRGDITELDLGEDVELKH